MQVGFGGLLIDAPSGSTAEYAIDGGTLSVSRFFSLGQSGEGRIRQTGGEVTLGAIPSDTAYFAYFGGSRAIYELLDGSLSISGELRVAGGDGEIVQSGGLLRVGSALVLAEGRNARARYELSGGDLQTAITAVGFTNRAEFIHSGGRHTAGNIRISESNFPMTEPPLTSVYYLHNDGVIEVGTIDVGGGSAGQFNHESGEVTATGGIRIAISGDSQTQSQYHLQAGALTVGGTEVGISNNGLFRQTGGNHVVNGALRISGSNQCQCLLDSSYELLAGKLEVNGPMFVGHSSNHLGEFLVAGGEAEIDSFVTLGVNAGQGTIRVEEGRLSIAGDLLLGESAFSRGIVEVAGGLGEMTVGGRWLTRVAPDPNYRPRLDVLINDTGLTTLSITGTAMLAGDLHVAVADETALSVGTQFVVLTAGGGISGSLQLTGPDRDQFSLTISEGEVVLTVVVPEPCSTATTVIAVIGFWMRRRLG
jgi:hypothetical protein